MILKTVFEKQIYYENRMKLLRFEFIKGFRKIIQISLCLKKKKSKITFHSLERDLLSLFR